jgi:hypothetical protein
MGYFCRRPHAPKPSGQASYSQRFSEKPALSRGMARSTANRPKHKKAGHFVAKKLHHCSWGPFTAIKYPLQHTAPTT